MIKKLKTFVTNVGIAGLLLAPSLVPAVASAQVDPRQGVCSGAQNLLIPGDDAVPEGCASADAVTPVNNLISTIINIFSVIVGVIAVIMVIYGGFKYIISGGDSGKISAAQQTIIYAIVGLIIVALAQIVVRFILARAVGSTEDGGDAGGAV